MAIRTIEDAENVIASGSFSADFDEAVDYLLTNDRNNPALDFLNKGSKDEEKLKRVTEYFRKVETLDNIDYQEFVNATNVWRSIKKNEFSFDRLHNITLDDQVIYGNTVAIQNIMGAADFDKEVIQDREIEGIQNQTTYVDDDGKIVPLTGDGFTATSAQEARLKSSKQRALLAHSIDEGFLSRSESERKRVLINTIKTDMYTSWLTTVGASAVNPSDNRAEASKKFNDAIEAALAGRPVTVKTDHILNDAIRALEALKNRQLGLLKAKCKKSASLFNKIYHKFGHTVGDYFGTKAELKLAGIYLAKHGKKRFGTNIAASIACLGLGGFGIATGSLPLAITAAASYSLYSAASNAIFTVWEKQNATKRALDEAGKDSSKWVGIAGFKNTFAKIKSNKQEYKDYKRRNLVLGGFGLAGAGAALAVGAVATSATAAAAGTAGTYYAVAKFVSATARVFGFNTNAGVDVHQARKVYKADKTNAKNKHEYHRRIGSLITTLLLSGAAEVVMANGMSSDTVDPNATNSNLQTDTPAVTPVKAGSLATVKNDTIQQTNSEVSEHSNTTAAVVNSTTSNATEIKVPTEWNENMGITEQHWNMMQDRFANGNMSFEEAYTNVVKAQQANPELFKDINPVKVVDEFFLKDSWVADWKAVGVFDSKDGLISKLHLNPNAQVVDVEDFDDFEAVNGAIYHNQITVTNAQGQAETLDFYSTDAEMLHKHDTMFRLERIIKCGDRVDIDTQDANDMILAARVAGDKNVGVKSFGGCGDNDTYTHGYIKKHATELHRNDQVNAAETVEQVKGAGDQAVAAETIEYSEVARNDLTASVKLVRTSTNGGVFNDPTVMKGATVVNQGDLGAEAVERLDQNAQEQGLNMTNVIIEAKTITRK